MLMNPHLVRIKPPRGLVLLGTGALYRGLPPPKYLVFHLLVLAGRGLWDQPLL